MNQSFGRIHPSLLNEVVERPFTRQVTNDLPKLGRPYGRHWQDTYFPSSIRGYY